jgi:hypothetical protein
VLPASVTLTQPSPVKGEGFFTVLIDPIVSDPVNPGAFFSGGAAGFRISP